MKFLLAVLGDPEAPFFPYELRMAPELIAMRNNWPENGFIRGGGWRTQRDLRNPPEFFLHVLVVDNVYKSRPSPTPTHEMVDLWPIDYFVVIASGFYRERCASPAIGRVADTSMWSFELGKRLQ